MANLLEIGKLHTIKYWSIYLTNMEHKRLDQAEFSLKSTRGIVFIWSITVIICLFIVFLEENSMVE